MSSTESEYESINDLPGVGGATEDRMRNEYGLETLDDVSKATESELADIKGISEDGAQEIYRAANEATGSSGFTSGAKLLNDHRELNRLTTGVDELDDAFDGGLQQGKLVEISGQNGSGKSQCSHQFAVTAQLPTEVGGLHGSVVWLDTEDTFSPSRIEEIVLGLSAERKAAAIEEEGIEGTINDDETMEELVQRYVSRIQVAKVYNTDHQIMMTEKAEEMVDEKFNSDYPVKLIITDSLTAHYRGEFTEMNKLPERGHKMKENIQMLKTAIKKYDDEKAVAIITNQVTTNVGKMFGDPEEAYGGNILGHDSTYRLRLKPKKAQTRNVKLMDAPDIPPFGILVEITENGIESA